MRSKLVYALTLAGLTIALSTSCAKKPVQGDAAGANAAGDMQQPAATTPAVSDKPMDTDPQGSDSGKIAGLNTVHFDYDKDRLTSDAKKQLGENAEWIKAHANYTIQVEGHTDARGSIEYNLALGERRAKSVKSYLQGLGIDTKRVTIISYGKEKPVDNGDGEGAWAKNRRANFVPLQ
jgi:peptidoglycan-associated lipoprotein